jgi:hypothetical protein
MHSKWALVILGVLATVIVAELARPAMSPEADGLSHLGLGLGYGVAGAVLLVGAIRFWWWR